MPDPWDTTSSPPARHPPDQPLPKLADVAKWVAQKVAPYYGRYVFGWDQGKLKEVEDNFKPKKVPGGMGCMQACYDVLAILYGPDTRKDLLTTVQARALAKADAWIKAHPQQYQAKVDALKAANPTMTDAKAKHDVRWELTSPHNTSDHLFNLMHERGLAGDMVNARNADVEKTIKDMTGGGAGVYFYGLAVNDNHTVTLAVERGADGSQKLYWLDQNNPSLNAQVTEGDLGRNLAAVHGHTQTTHIWALKETADAPKK